MKKRLITILALIFLIAGCSSSAGSAEGESMFKRIEKANYWQVMYHRKTKVMYTVSGGVDNRGTFTLLVNPDGSPMLYEEEE